MKINDWASEDRNINWLMDEIKQKMLPWKISKKDIIIFGGDLNSENNYDYFGLTNYVETGYPTQLDCKTGEGQQVDHLMSNMKIKPSKRSDLKFDILYTGCSFDEDLNDTHIKNRKHNRKLRAMNKDISDHLPVFAQFYYKK